MSFDRKLYRETIISALNASRAYNREDALLEMFVNEAELRYKAENISKVSVSTYDASADRGRANHFHRSRFV